MNRTFTSDDRHSKLGSLLTTIAIASITVALLSFISPQIGFFGRGLKTTIPALLLSGFSIFMVNYRAFFRAFFRFRIVFLFGFLFILQAAFRFAVAPETDAQWFRYVIGPILVLIPFLWIAALAELGRGALARLRFWFLITWGLSIGLGIPALFGNPGVARLTMGGGLAPQNMAIWAPLGVGEYTVYTAFAICIAPIFSATERMKGMARWVGYSALSAGAVAVLLSTFTMAAALLVIGMVASLVASALTSRHHITRKVRLLLLTLILVVIPSLYGLFTTWEPTSFVITKINSLAMGVSAQGLAKGDETERGGWFVEELTTFQKRPLLGYASEPTSQIEHGHSSFSNSLVLFGLIGSLLWYIAMWKAFRMSHAGLTHSIDRKMLLISTLLLLASGVLNPSWHSPGILVSLFALTIPDKIDF